MPLQESLVHELIRLLYQAASDPSAWPAFLRRLQTATDSSRAYIMMGDRHLRSAVASHNDFDEALLSLWAKEYADNDPLVHAYARKLKQNGGVWTGTWQTVMDQEPFLSSDGFNDIMRPQGDLHLLAASLESQNEVDGGFTSLALRRHRTQSAFSPEAEELMRVLTPHLQQAMRLNSRLAELQEQRDALRTSADSYGRALLWIAQSGRILDGTERALGMLSKDTGLTSRNGMLHTTDSASDQDLQQAIGSAVSVGSPRVRYSRLNIHQVSGESTFSPQAGGTVSIPRAGKHPLRLLILPHLGPPSTPLAGVAALVFILDAEQPEPSRTELLRNLFQFSPTECRIAELLLTGLDARTIAEATRIGHETVRFHLKRIFSKTGVRRQSELVRLLVSLPGTPPS